MNFIEQVKRIDKAVDDLDKYTLYWRVVDVISDFIVFCLLTVALAYAISVLNIDPFSALAFVAGSYAMGNQFNREYVIYDRD
jgi:hypothetical protein